MSPKDEYKRAAGRDLGSSDGWGKNVKPVPFSSLLFVAMVIIGGIVLFIAVSGLINWIFPL